LSHFSSKHLSTVSTRAIQLSQNQVQPKTCYEAKKYPSHSMEPRSLCKVEKEFQAHMDRIVGLWLFLDEIDNNICGDGANGYEDGSGYPASPSREALHRMDHKTRPSGNLILVLGPITEHLLCSTTKGPPMRNSCARAIPAA